MLMLAETPVLFGSSLKDHRKVMLDAKLGK
jgi:hypothetical protein